MPPLQCVVCVEFVGDVQRNGVIQTQVEDARNVTKDPLDPVSLQLCRFRKDVCNLACRFSRYQWELLPPRELPAPVHHLVVP